MTDKFRNKYRVPSTRLQNWDYRSPGAYYITICTHDSSYKSAITYHVHRLGFDFQWQPRFHDYIIRDEKIFQKIAKYIRDNPANWEKDRFYKNNF
ncbi:MAG TPA: hypothetical protein PLH70_00280 [Bacteroidales bacterium]|nr:hypothetical protein [Bacteroidales bacterium]HOH21758.1 hypothetical protein [Bacteroidales bacterium]HPB57356.1 hypothetical protein [Bacteroidales bacterium]HPZ02897.1 hypothetical protein [Bacteroidales bacterium]HQB74221.1 hypothetical protein [Bacteroidales bacterium]